VPKQRNFIPSPIKNTVSEIIEYLEIVYLGLCIKVTGKKEKFCLKESTTAFMQPSQKSIKNYWNISYKNLRNHF
jgi:hypothetical protein